jgi:D-arabinose 1-dehydrogenase-like Zn-dependent alcohol dehydrogenase
MPPTRSPNAAPPPVTREPLGWGTRSEQDVVAAILEQEPLGLDIVFECCGQQEALDQAMKLLRPGGTPDVHRNPRS